MFLSVLRYKAWVWLDTNCSLFKGSKSQSGLSARVSPWHFQEVRRVAGCWDVRCLTSLHLSKPVIHLVKQWSSTALCQETCRILQRLSQRRREMSGVSTSYSYFSDAALPPLVPAAGMMSLLSQRPENNWTSNWLYIDDLRNRLTVTNHQISSWSAADDAPTCPSSPVGSTVTEQASFQWSHMSFREELYAVVP